MLDTCGVFLDRKYIPLGLACGSREWSAVEALERRERVQDQAKRSTYDQERSRALPRTNKCQDQREYNGKSRAHKI